MNCQCCPHIETSKLICTANQLTGFYMTATVAFNGLRSARNQIECAFDLRKARCAILTRKVDLKLENLPNLICVCFVLHKRKKKRKVTLMKS